MKKTYLRKLAVTVEGGFATFLYISNILLIENYCEKFLLINLDGLCVSLKIQLAV